MISVVVPTFDRPESLRRAVLSVFAQTLARRTGFTLLIVDNTPSGTAAATLEALRQLCPGTITFKTLHAPEPGVANARNAGMDAAEGSLIAFLDDDQSAPPDWLEGLLAAYEKTPAAVTFGPVKTALPDGITRHRAYFEAFFARTLEAESGYIDQTFGCGNALIDFAQIEGSQPWFDAKMNEMGGEDDLLFDRVRRAGQRFAWAADAVVWEHPPQARVTLSYAMKRAFSYGQAPLTLAVKGPVKRYRQIPLWMAIGAGKALWHGPQWLALTALRHPNRAFQLDRTIRGVSKLFWWVDLKFYGRAALKSAASVPGSTEKPRQAVGLDANPAPLAKQT